MTTQKEIVDLFEYREGNLYRRKSIAGWPAGHKAGCLHKSGYMQVRLGGVCYQLHRLIFLYHMGYLPTYIDHIDGDISNNRIENLRECTVAQNNRNARVKKTNKLGVKGVRQLTSGTYEARIWKDGKRINIGYFPTLAEAKKAYDTCAKETFGEFVRIA
jgi:hypothetical protein